MPQIIISVGREFGSGGRVIAEALAERFQIPVYDRHLITEIAEKTGLSHEEVERYNEVPKSRLASRRVRGFSNSIEDNIAEMQFEIMDKKAASGESFVIVGRCSETKLKKYTGLISIFVLGDMSAKIKRVMEIYNLSENEAKALIEKKDRRRKSYHDYHVNSRWGEARFYDITINSSRLGIERTVDILEEYIKARINNK